MKYLRNAGGKTRTERFKNVRSGLNSKVIDKYEISMLSKCGQIAKHASQEERKDSENCGWMDLMRSLKREFRI